MILLNLKLDGIYGFENFEINFTYPKKIVNSLINDEHLDGRDKFRYKKVIILMGANATGKTSLGKALLRIFSYINSGNPSYLYEMVSDNKEDAAKEAAAAAAAGMAGGGMGGMY